MDRDLINVALEEVKSFAGDQFKFPESIYKHIAYRMVKENKMGDHDWIEFALQDTQKYIEHKRELAEKGGYAPFVFLGKSAFNWIKKNCAEWVLPHMEKAFRDPEDIHPEWAVQCAKTMSVLGKEVCEGQEDLYNFLTDHPEWEVQQVAREEFRREWMRLKRNWERRNNEGPQNNGHRRPNNHNNQGEHRPNHQGRSYQQNNRNSHQNSRPQAPQVEAQLDIVVKFEEMPRGRPAMDPQYTNFELLSEGRVLHVEVKRTVYDRLLRMTREGQAWIAVMSGRMGPFTGDGFRIERPFVQIYNKNQPEQAEFEESNQSDGSHTVDDSPAEDVKVEMQPEEGLSETQSEMAAQNEAAVPEENLNP